MAFQLDSRIPLSVQAPVINDPVAVMGQVQRVAQERQQMQQEQGLAPLRQQQMEQAVQLNGLRIEDSRRSMEEADRQRQAAARRQDRWKSSSGVIEDYLKKVKESGDEDPDYVLGLEKDLLNRKQAFRAEDAATRAHNDLVAAKQAESVNAVRKESDLGRRQMMWDARRAQGLREGWLTKEQHASLPDIVPDEAKLEEMEIATDGAVAARAREDKALAAEAKKREDAKKQLDLDTADAYQSFLVEVPDGGQAAWVTWRKKQKPLVQSRLPVQIDAKLPSGETVPQMFGRLAGFRAEKPQASDKSINDIEAIAAGLRAKDQKLSVDASLGQAQAMKHQQDLEQKRTTSRADDSDKDRRAEYKSFQDRVDDLQVKKDELDADNLAKGQLSKEYGTRLKVLSSKAAQGKTTDAEDEEIIKLQVQQQTANDAISANKAKYGELERQQAEAQRRKNALMSAGETSTSAPKDGDTVEVEFNGVVGTIPRANLAAAKARGAKETKK